MGHDRGFTITEVLVAILIFTAVTVPLTTLLHRMVSDNTVRLRLRAVLAAQSAMETALARTDLTEESGEKPVEQANGFEVYRKVEGQGAARITVAVKRSGRILYELQTLCALPDSAGG